MKKFFNSSIPLWLVLAIFFLSGAAAITTIVYFREVAYQYALYFANTDGSSLKFEYGVQPTLEDANFFMITHRKFIDSKANFIEADLSAMKLTVYRDGASVFVAPILTKGREGSWWETPAGVYKIESKEKNHFSSMGHVYQPWSMVFQGNFFIHGWPYYTDNTPVASTYSGGCIRLSTEDAKQVYDYVSVGMPVLVFEKDFIEDTFTYAQKKPFISAESILAADLHSNYVLWEKDSKTIRSVASLTKLMTALVVTEYINIEKEIVVTSDMLIETSKPRLQIGESVSAYQLLYPLLLESSNESAEALAQFLGRERFISLMNKKAESLGMKHTHFVDPAGVQAENTSTAEDCFLLAKYLYNNRRFILDITNEKRTNTAYEKTIFKDLANFNVFFDDPMFIGGKTGVSTSAKETIISLFELQIGTSVRPVVIIALGAENAALDARTIFSYITNNFEQ
ncbi:MAG: L,D-transpeptidase family protein [bacterium]